MKEVKKINILEETEIPYVINDTDSQPALGATYDASMHIVKKDYAGHYNYADVNELVYDDNYIVAEAKLGDIYQQRLYDGSRWLDLSFSRNNYIVNKTGTLYSHLGRDDTDIDFNLSQFPSGSPVTFDNDMLVLTSIYDGNNVNQITFTGDAYCVKSIYKSNVQTETQTLYIDITAKKLGEDNYQNINCGRLYAFNGERLEDVYFIHEGKSNSLLSTDDSFEYGASNILNQQQLINYVEGRLFNYTGDYNSIINYIIEKMPYGGVMLNPFKSFAYLGLGLGWIDGDFMYASDESTILQLSTILMKDAPVRFVPIGYRSKQWIIPFISQEEYNAACCAKDDRSLSRYKTIYPYLPF